MSRKFKILMIVFVSFIVGSGLAMAGGILAFDHSHDYDGQEVPHSGRLDKCGGHTDSVTGEYHYHQGPYC